MADIDKKTTDLVELTTPAIGDVIHIVDISDTTDDSAGSSKKIKIEKIIPAGGTIGQVLMKKSDSDFDTEFDDLVAVSVTTKGDLQTHDGSTPTALPVGTDGQILMADDAESNGIKWSDPPTSVSVTTKGDIQTHDATTPDRLPVGVDGQILSADSTEDTGLKWIDAPSGSSNSIINNEVPSGTIDGSNTSFTLASTPVAGSVSLYMNGVLQQVGASNDYTISGLTITFNTAPLIGSILLANYLLTTGVSDNADTVDGFNANATPTANNIPVLDSNAKIPLSTINPIHQLNAPQGFLINGKIVPSVASNNLTVTIKGLDGNDPSATNPVYCRIGDTIRTITSALSVTTNAGTNWFDSGSTKLATYEIDYFVYLGYNGTDGVVLGFSRIPYVNEYSQFSTTNTNEKYCAISTITNAASGDDYEVIGRFAATLSAGAGYTWTVPTFTNINLIQKSIYKTRTLSMGGTVTSESGTLTTVSQIVKYELDMNKLSYTNVISVTNNGTGADGIQAPITFIPDTDLKYPVYGTNSSYGYGLIGFFRTSGICTVKKYENSYPVGGSVGAMCISGYYFI